MAAWDNDIIEQFRANGGKVGGPFAGYNLLLLTTVGAKSGRRHTKPLMYLAEGGWYVVVAANAGAAAHPAWFRNLCANPAATAEVGAAVVETNARVIEPGPEYDRLYGAMTDILPVLGDFACTAGRLIPVVALVPRG